MHISQYLYTSEVNAHRSIRCILNIQNLLDKLLTQKFISFLTQIEDLSRLVILVQVGPGLNTLVE